MNLSNTYYVNLKSNRADISFQFLLDSEIVHLLSLITSRGTPCTHELYT